MSEGASAETQVSSSAASAAADDDATTSFDVVSSVRFLFFGFLSPLKCNGFGIFLVTLSTGPGWLCWVSKYLSRLRTEGGLEGSYVDLDADWG